MADSLLNLIGVKLGWVLLPFNVLSLGSLGILPLILAFWPPHQGWYPQPNCTGRKTGSVGLALAQSHTSGSGKAKI